MPSLAALNRKSRQLRGRLMKQAKQAVAARAAQTVADGVAADARFRALADYLAADPHARAWNAWQAARAADKLLRMRNAFAEYTALAANEPAAPAIPDGEAERRCNRSQARFLLMVAYGADVARREALAKLTAEWHANEPTEVSDDPERARWLAARRKAIAAADAATVDRPTLKEPTCSPVARGAVAMLALLTSPALVEALPGTVRTSLMLPDALRVANMLLPQSAQASMDTARPE